MRRKRYAAASSAAARRGMWPARASSRSASRVLRARRSGIAPAPDKLQRLHQELDLADAALAQLHVMAGRDGNAAPRRTQRSGLPPRVTGVASRSAEDVEERGGTRLATSARRRGGCRGGRDTLSRRFAPHWPAARPNPTLRQRIRLRVDPLLHGVDVGHRREIQPAAPYERPDRLQERRPKRQVAGHRARLDHRGALPVLPHALVIRDGVGHGHDGRRRRRVGPQPQIGPEHVAVGVARLHQRHQAARKSRCEAGLGIPFGAFGVYWRRRVVQQHEVHIGRIVQFARAELAHAEHREPARRSRIVRVRQQQLAGIVRGPQQMGDRRGVSAASARSLSAAVTCSSRQIPPRSATAVARATTRLARRSAAATCSRRLCGGSACRAASASSTTRCGPRAMSGRRARRPRAPRGPTDTGCCRRAPPAWPWPQCRPAEPRLGAAEFGRSARSGARRRRDRAARASARAVGTGAGIGA